MYAFYDLLKELPAGVARGAAGAIGSFESPGKPRKRRRIPIELFRQILREQGNPWADELEDTYQETEKRLASPKISKKHKEVLEETLEAVSESVSAPVDWAGVISSLRAAQAATRTTLAIKHAQAALLLVKAQEDWDAAEEDDIAAIAAFLETMD